MENLNERNVDYSSAEVENVNMRDYPDFCDAYISSMDWDDGTVMTDEELENWCEENPDEVYEIVVDSTH